MGKGDKRTKRGKIFLGSHGNTRRKKKSYRPPEPEPQQENKA